MENTAKVAIVIANYNGQDVLSDCIQSILKSDYSDFNIILVDDRSDDFDEQITAMDTRIICLRNQVNQGFAKTTNRGIAYALRHGYDYVMLLNNDTEIHRQMISRLVHRSEKKYVTVPKMYYASSPDMIWYAGGILDRESGYAHHIGNKQKDFDSVHCKKVSFATGCCMMIPINVIKKVGMLDPIYYMYYEDVAFSASLLLNHIKILYVSDAMLWHKVGSAVGGAGNVKQRYYILRNHLYFIKNSLYICDKKKAYRIVIKDNVNDLKDPRKDRAYKKSIMSAWRDFLLGRMGKTLRFH